MKRETGNAKRETGERGSGNGLGMVLLLGLLSVVALRLTMTETARFSLAQIGSMVAAGRDPEGVKLPEMGPGVTLGLSAATMILAGAAAWWAGKRGGMAGTHWRKWILIAGIGAVGVVSVFQSAGRFYALVGLCDVLMGILGGWGVAVLCRAMGDRGRRMVIAVVVAILAAWTAKGFYQRFVEIPDTIDYYQKNRDKALAAQGMSADDPGTKLFESRMMSKEVGGYVTLSNVMATGMVGMLAVVAGVLGARWGNRELRTENSESIETRNAKRETRNGEDRTGEIPIGVVLGVCLGIVAIGGMVVTFLSASRGGSVMAVVCVLAIGVGYWKRAWVVRQRKRLLVGAGIVFAAGMVAMVGYGLVRDTLPSKSMMFRWHYWTGAAGMIGDHALWGVGLNDFGDYYPVYKRASSPEEVKDPHSFFVRVAAEMGVPAALGVGALLVWMAAGMVRGERADGEVAVVRVADVESARGVEAPPPVGLVWGGIFCVVWWGAHQLIAEPWDPYSAYLNMFAMVIAWGGFAAAWVLTGNLSREMVRGIVAAGAVGALGMFVYDQVNMALVTGGVAMLFWILLGAADSYVDGAVKKVKGRGAAGVLGVAGLIVAGAVWVPVLMGKMAWDPEPQQIAAEGALANRDYRGAEEALTGVLYHTPMALDAIQEQVDIKRQLGERVDAGEIWRMLGLTHNARFWLKVGLTAKELSVKDRAAILKQAREWNEALPKDEIMRFTPEEEGKLREMEEALSKH